MSSIVDKTSLRYFYFLTIEKRDKFELPTIFGAHMVLDVVCGMEIDEKTAKWKSEYKGKTYYFCGPLCKLEFDENPDKHLSSTMA